MLKNLENLSETYYGYELDVDNKKFKLDIMSNYEQKKLFENSLSTPCCGWKQLGTSHKEIECLEKVIDKYYIDTTIGEFIYYQDNQNINDFLYLITNNWSDSIEKIKYVY